MIKSYLMCLVVMNVACMQVTDKQAEETVPVTQDIQTASVVDNLVEITGLEPHKYSVSFQVKMNEAVVVKKLGGSEVVFPLTKEKWTDVEVVEGSEIKYVLGYYENSNFVETRTLTAAIPLDLTVKELKDLSAEKSYARMFFTKDLALLTMGTKLNLKAKEIYFQNNKIETFPPNQKAALSINGHHGGEIILEADKISGDLTVVLQGEGGGDGQNASAMAPAATGPTGAKAQYQQYHIGGELGFAWRCIGNPTDGGPGAPGAKGNSGQPGSNGGSTGSMLIKANDVSNFKLVPNKLAGKPGYGGAGGPGQPGGAGGAPGSNEAFGYSDLPCKAATAGAPGPTGPYGDRGSDGQPGTVQSICYLVNNQRACE